MAGAETMIAAVHREAVLRADLAAALDRVTRTAAYCSNDRTRQKMHIQAKDVDLLRGLLARLKEGP